MNGSGRDDGAITAQQPISFPSPITTTPNKSRNALSLNASSRLEARWRLTHHPANAAIAPIPTSAAPTETPAIPPPLSLAPPPDVAAAREAPEEFEAEDEEDARKVVELVGGRDVGSAPPDEELGRVELRERVALVAEEVRFEEEAEEGTAVVISMTIVKAPPPPVDSVTVVVTCSVPEEGPVSVKRVVPVSVTWMGWKRI